MTRTISILLAFAACSASAPAPLLADHVERLLMIDAATCRATSGAGSVYWNGAAWAFAGLDALRCPLALEWQDVVTGFEVYGGHLSGPVATTACLAVCEPLTPGAPCQEVQPCAAPVASPAGVLSMSATGLSAGFGEDLNGHIAIRGAAGDTVAGLIFYVQRLH